MAQREDWKGNGFHSRQAYGPWKRRGFTAAQARAWRDALNTSDARSRDVSFGGPDHAAEWRDRGFEPGDAQAWIDAGFMWSAAAEHRDRGLSPSRARRLQRKV